MNGLDDGTAPLGRQLASQVLDVGTDNLWKNLGLHAPSLLNELRVGEQSARVPKEGRQDQQLLRAEDDLGEPTSDSSRRQIQHDVTRPQEVGSCRSAPTRERPRTSQKFDEGERLDEIVICTCVEPRDPILDRVAGSKQKDRHVRATRSKGAADGEAIEVREHPVEHDSGIRLRGREAEGRLAVLTRIDDEAVLLEAVGEGVCEVERVLDEKEPHGHQSTRTAREAENGRIHEIFTFAPDDGRVTSQPARFVIVSTLLGAVLVSSRPSFADDAPASARPAARPAYVSEQKRMGERDLAKKREGFYVTGLPFFSSDPLNGLGGGATGYLHYNGNRDDPFFAYTPYRARLGVKGEYTTGNAAAVALKLDAPFIADTAWRLKVDGKYESTPNNLYFGLTEGTLAPFPDGKYSTYARRLSTVRPGGPGEAPIVADNLKHYFVEREWMLNIKGERVLFDGNWRVLVGYEIQHLSYGTYENTLVEATDPATGEKVRVPNGRSLLREDAAAGRAFGLGGGRASLVQLSLMYDTRDFDPDPYRGVFFEFGNEHSAKYTGSEFTFHKMLLQARHYLPIAPRVLRRTLLATRLGYGTILGEQAPFFEFQDQWSAEGSIRALGGSQTLRGFKANRFLGRTVGFVNIEFRHRFADFDAIGQNFTLTVAPFLDLGSVGDKVLLVAPTIRASAGAGLRIGWNRSTVIVADAAFSREDAQFFVNFNQSY